MIDGYCKDPKGDDIIEVEEKSNSEWSVDGVVAPSRRISHNSRKWAFEDIREVLKRRYLLRQVAIEIFSSDGRNHLVVFTDVVVRDEVFQKLSAIIAIKYDTRLHSFSCSFHFIHLIPSLHTFASYSRFIPLLHTSLHTLVHTFRFIPFDSYPRFIPSLHTLASYLCFIPSLHTLASYLCFILPSLHTPASYPCCLIPSLHTLASCLCFIPRFIPLLHSPASFLRFILHFIYSDSVINHYCSASADPGQAEAELGGVKDKIASVIGKNRQILTQKWVSGQISNFQYLMHLNTLAGMIFYSITVRYNKR